MSQPQARAVNRDKSEIMVELMPLQGNSGRVSSKIHTGRNNGQFAENFNQKMEQRTTEQESLRLLQKNTGETGTKANTMVAPMPKAVNHSGPKIKKQHQSGTYEQQMEDDVYSDDMDSQTIQTSGNAGNNKNNGLQEKRS